MKVILLKDIPKIGKRGMVMEMNDGYVRNFLIPNRLAQMATPEALASLLKIKNMAIAENKVQRDLLTKNLKELEGITVVIKKPANEKGHLFSAIHADDIVENLKEKHHTHILPENLVIDTPIKTLGTFPIDVSVGDMKGKFTLVVEASKK